MTEQRALRPLDRPWRASIIVATAGYFAFPIVWACVNWVLEAPPVRERAAVRWSQLFDAVTGSVVIALLGLIFLVGLLFWLAAFGIARLKLFAFCRARIRHWAVFCVSGAIAGVMLGALFARFTFSGQFDRYPSSVVAGMLTGAFVGWVAVRTSAHHPAKRVR